jgi:hypothetical protein
MQPRETLYHKTVEMAWRTKMLIGKVSSERKFSSLKDNKDHKKRLKEVLSRLRNLEASTKWLIEDQKEKMERVAAQFHLYLCYVHHMDITPADENGAPALIRKTRTVVQKEENKDRADEGKKHLIILD